MENSYLGSIALIGGGPAALLVLKNLVDSNLRPDIVYVFEKNERLGVGMPYGKYGALKEHVANISANELPKFDVSFEEYLKKHPTRDYPDFSVNGQCNSYQVIPRLLLGDYLEYQFTYYIKAAKGNGIKVIFKTNSTVDDITKLKKDGGYEVLVNNQDKYLVEKVILCTGHFWPKKNESHQKNWYDSPYPPSKFVSQSNFAVAIRGTSLTAVDALKTQSRLNGIYETQNDGSLKYTLKKGSENFRIDLFSTGGFLPALRFHSEDSAYDSSWTMSLDDIYKYKKSHGGFVDLDYVFEINFKKPLEKRDPEFYKKIENLSIEEFVDEMMKIRKELDSFQLFKAEYNEAEKSIRRHQSVSWKEALSAFSYAMNYPAKHFSAEDMLRLRKTLLPLISIIIASLPQSSYREIIALYNAGIVNLIQVNKDSFVEPHPESGGIYHYKSSDDRQEKRHYQLYIDAIGQQPLEVSDLPFISLKNAEFVSSGYLAFKDNDQAEQLLEYKEIPVIAGNNENYYLKVHGLEINDYFQSLNQYGETVPDLFIMAVPFIGGLNPDYSGLDFCDTAAARIMQVI